MSTGATVAIVVVALIVIALIAVLVKRGGGMGGVGAGTRLKHRFGPEYDRVLERHDGDAKATQAELAERVRLHGDLDLRELPAASRERYAADWAAVQARFVDEPSRAVSEADSLIGEIAAERGFPRADAPEHFDALSVHHPHDVQSYRQTHALVGGNGQSQGRKQSTEDLRKALLSVRGLYENLLREDGRSARRSGGDVESERESESEYVAEPAADDDKASGRRGGRFAALTGGRRHHEDDETDQTA